MLIDWFTVFAQIINFLVLVWLMKRFLYKPIMNAVRAREQLVKDQIALADEKTLNTEALLAEFNEKNMAFERDRASNLNQVAREVEQVKTTMLAEAKRDYEQLSQKQKEALQEAEQQMQREIVQLAQTEVLKIARSTLQTLASESLEKQMVHVFIDKLKGLDAYEQSLLTNSVNVSKSMIIIRSAFTVGEVEQEALKTAIKEVLNQEIQLRFEHKQELISGIELVTDGYRLSWNTDEYVNQIANKTMLAEKNRIDT